MFQYNHNCFFSVSFHECLFYVHCVCVSEWHILVCALLKPVKSHLCAEFEIGGCLMNELPMGVGALPQKIFVVTCSEIDSKQSG